MPARILIIEDDQPSRDLLTYLFGASGYAVLGADDGEGGVRAALDHAPDLVLCDLQMPVLNGFDVLKRLRQDPNWRRVPVIAVTAFSMAGDRDEALAAGFDGYFPKPIDPETFVATIEAYLAPEHRAPRRSAGT
jgi:two-component system cell cycle response regulator DivK